MNIRHLLGGKTRRGNHRRQLVRAAIGQVIRKAGGAGKVDQHVGFYVAVGDGGKNGEVTAFGLQINTRNHKAIFTLCGTGADHTPHFAVAAAKQNTHKTPP